MTYEDYYELKYDELSTDLMVQVLEVDGREPTEDEIDDYIYEQWQARESEQDDYLYDQMKDDILTGDWE